MGRKGGVNEKVQKANEKKAANEAVKNAKKAAALEKELAAEWSKGANNRGAARASAASEKAEEARRKKEAKAALVAAEEAEMSGVSTKVKTVGAGQKSKASKKKKKNDLSLLEDALISSADKKAKKSAAEKRRKQRELEEARKKKEAQQQKAQQQLDPLLANTNAMIGEIGEDDDMVGRQLNKTLQGEYSGIDSALNSLNISSGKDAHPEKRMKAAYLAYEEKMLPIMKSDYPGLRLTQYKEKIFASWKKSPENPMNQQQ